MYKLHSYKRSKNTNQFSLVKTTLDVTQLLTFLQDYSSSA